MYPPQTSLIPATVALVRFFLTNGFSSFSQNYPYWYLGTTPYRYLIGPIIPLMYSFFRIFLKTDSLFNITIYLIIFSIILSGVGWTWLASKISGDKRKIFLTLSFLVFIVFPYKYLYALALGEVSYFLAICFLPFAFIFAWNYLKDRSLLNLILSSFFAFLMLLIHTNVLVSYIVGDVALVLASVFKNGRIGKFEKRLKRSFLPLLTGLAAVTFWFGPGFWKMILLNPGIGGQSSARVLVNILGFFKNIVPLILVVVFVKFRAKFKDPLSVFTYIWLGSFLVLTIFRFLANPSFWMDYISWFPEMEIGLWFITISLIFPRIASFKLDLTHFVPLSVSVLTASVIFRSLGSPSLISKNPPVVTDSLSEICTYQGKTVFVTGSNTFWLNAFCNVRQVRGGRDEVSIDPLWRDASYDFREGQNVEKIRQDLGKLNVSYVLVNTKESADYYKDFKNISLWPKVGTPVSSFNGDIIYKIQN